MNKYFGWLLAAMTSLTLVSAYADAKAIKKVVEEEENVEEMAPAIDSEEQVAAVVVDEEEVEVKN